jgi:hypothetical protein
MPRATKKTNKKLYTKRRKQLRRQKSTKKTHFVKPPKIEGVYIQTLGTSETNIDVNNKKSQSKLKWLGDYDGEIAKLQVDVNNDNNRKVYKFEMNNEQLSHLLGMPPVDMPLDKRLEMNFLGREPVRKDVDLMLELSNKKNEIPFKGNKANKGNILPVFTNNKVMVLQNGLPRSRMRMIK